MKAITYHYVRKSVDVPKNLIYLSYQDFIKQIDWFRNRYKFISKEDFYSSIKSRKVNSRSIVFSFDDGIIDHYNYVFKHLLDINHWGFFFISAGPYLNKKLLNVHRVHFILSTVGAEEALNNLKKLINKSMLASSKIEEFDNSVYRGQNINSPATTFKKIINYFLKDKWKSEILDYLFKKIIPPNQEKDIIKKFYLSVDQIKKMHDKGMVIGSHGVNHHVMSTLTEKNKKEEIKTSCEFLSNVIDKKIDTFAYPYGSENTFDASTKKF